MFGGVKVCLVILLCVYWMLMVLSILLYSMLCHMYASSGVFSCTVQSFLIF